MPSAPPPSPLAHLQCSPSTSHPLTAAHAAVQAGSQFWGTFDFASPAFDWGSSYSPPGLGLKDLVIYEMSVRCFTADPSSGVSEEARGTYKGIIEKVRPRCVLP